MFFSSEEYFLPEAAILLKHFIASNEGNEVLVIGKVNTEGLVYEGELIAMGNDYSVPAVLSAAKPGNIIIHNHPSGNIRPSDADLTLAAIAAEKSVGSYIVDNNVTKVFPIVKWLPHETTEKTEISEESVRNILDTGGTLEKEYKGFEHREPQLEMSLKTANAINREHLLVAEAGTGTGKSFAYLVPAMLHVQQNEGEKVVISTSTIALEEQLVEKDLPFLKDKLDMQDLPIAILKGRNNYICLRKYTLYKNGAIQLSFNKSENSHELVENIDNWLELPGDGSKSSLGLSISGDIWTEINSDEHTCERSKCRYFEKCFFYKARRKANFASILLINHHLLMADVSVKMELEEGTLMQGGVLPKYNTLVIDEAHNLFKSAISFLGETVSTYSVFYNLRRLFNTERTSGVLIKLLEHTREKELNEKIEKLIKSISAFTPYYINSIIPEFMECFDPKESYFELDLHHRRKELGVKFGKVVKFLAETAAEVSSIHRKLDETIEKDPLKRPPEDDNKYSLASELKGVGRRIEMIIEFLENFFTNESSTDLVFWADRQSKRGVRLTTTPVEIQKILVENIYEKIKTVIFTSATLSTGDGEDGFKFFARESGVDRTNREIEMLQLSSCFDYKKVLRAFIPADLPSPQTPFFDDASVDAAKNFIKASKGGALVLFTSIRHREAAKEKFKNFPYTVISQQDYSLGSVVRNFKKDVNSSLLATDTFWEGVDMKGDTLRNLIIVRLPFRFPSHPFIKRYIANLEKTTGEGGFMLFTLPNAILKFKQGLGRLIRTKTDRGTITVLDKRLIEKSYGRDFIKSLPDGVNFSVMPIRGVTKHIESFFGNINK